MQTATESFISELKKSHSVSSEPLVTLEWNQNRFDTDLVVSNNGVVPTEDDEVFPITSIAAARRPESPGIVKGITSSGSLGREAPARRNAGIPVERRTYAASPDAKYKYWIGPNKSSSTQTSGTYAISNCTPQVAYKYSRKTNKLMVQFENSVSSPKSVVVQYTLNGTTWITAGTTHNPNSNGRIELYLQDDGTWSSLENLNNALSVKGVRASVTKMDRPHAHCHVIEISAMYKMDVTDRVINFSSDFRNSEASFVAPLGKAETATGDISLSNDDGMFDNDRRDNFLYGMMNSPAKVQISLTTTAGSQVAKTQIATMFVETWGDDSAETRGLSLSDASLFLKQEYPPEMLLRNVTGTEIIWRILDSIGFSNYVVDESPEGDMKAQFFWTDPEKSVWDHIKEISEGLQIACYFDEHGMLKIRTRERMYESDPDSSVWTLDGQNVTSEIATKYSRPEDLGKVTDIVSFEKSADLVANKVTVEHVSTSVSDINKRQPKMHTVWEPEGSVVLRSANLAATMSPTQGYGFFSDSNFATWPYEGMLQMNGEVMRWTKKRYQYRDITGAVKTKYISSDAEKDALDGQNNYLSIFNKFDGGLYFGDQRGLMSTIARTHQVGHKFESVQTRHSDHSIVSNSWYHKADYKNSVFKINTTKLFDVSSWTTARRGRTEDAAPKHIGTSLRFDNTNAYTRGAAGVFFGGNSWEEGYYVELSLTSWVSNRRHYGNEVTFYIRKRDGSYKRIGQGAVRGVSKGQWYDIDVSQQKVGSGYLVTVLVNGVRELTVTVPASDVLSDPMWGRYGVYARGHTHVQFEYLYAANTSETEPMDDATRWDLIEGGFRSNFYNRYLYRRKITERMKTKSSSRVEKIEGFSFDEFGSKAHEVREFEATFDPAPVIHSRLYFSNEWYAQCLEYVATNNSAKFIMAAKGRDNVILSGEDTLLYGSENPVDQKLFIYGRLVETGEPEKYEVRNEKSIRRVGEVELSLASPWIQTKNDAKKIGDWVANHWSNGSEVISIQSFGNPLLQVGDIVSVCYEHKDLSPEENQFYITGVRQSYDEGLTTSYTLQKKSNLIS